jgi:hypothetical protein
MTRNIRYSCGDIDGFATLAIAMNTVQVIGLLERPSGVNLIYRSQIYCKWWSIELINYRPKLYVLTAVNVKIM